MEEKKRTCETCDGDYDPVVRCTAMGCNFGEYGQPDYSAWRPIRMVCSRFKAGECLEGKDSRCIFRLGTTNINPEGYVCGGHSVDLVPVNKPGPGRVVPVSTPEYIRVTKSSKSSSYKVGKIHRVLRASNNHYRCESDESGGMVIHKTNCEPCPAPAAPRETPEYVRVTQGEMIGGVYRVLRENVAGTRWLVKIPDSDGDEIFIKKSRCEPYQPVKTCSTCGDAGTSMRKEPCESCHPNYKNWHSLKKPESKPDPEYRVVDLHDCDTCESTYKRKFEPFCLEGVNIRSKKHGQDIIGALHPYLDAHEIAWMCEQLGNH